MKGIRYIFEKLMSPFVSIAVLIDESKRINEDGAWDAYHRRRNEKEMKKMYRTDDPVADADRHDWEEQRWLDRLPKCAYCGEPIVDDKCYLINDELVCKECLEREHEKNTEDYMES